MDDLAHGAHRYDPDPRATTIISPCRCGMTRAYWAHQPLWWRLLNPNKRWR